MFSSKQLQRINQSDFNRKNGQVQGCLKKTLKKVLTISSTVGKKTSPT